MRLINWSQCIQKVFVRRRRVGLCVVALIAVLLFAPYIANAMTHSNKLVSAKGSFAGEGGAEPMAADEGEGGGGGVTCDYNTTYGCLTGPTPIWGKLSLPDQTLCIGTSASIPGPMDYYFPEWATNDATTIKSCSDGTGDTDYETFLAHLSWDADEPWNWITYPLDTSTCWPGTYSWTARWSSAHYGVCTSPAHDIGTYTVSIVCPDYNGAMIVPGTISCAGAVFHYQWFCTATPDQSQCSWNWWLMEDISLSTNTCNCFYPAVRVVPSQMIYGGCDDTILFHPEVQTSCTSVRDQKIRIGPTEDSVSGQGDPPCIWQNYQEYIQTINGDHGNNSVSSGGTLTSCTW
jgi:hypothetical protein